MRAIKQMLLRPLVKRILIGFGVFLLLFTITGFFIVPPVLKSFLIRNLSEQLHRDVSIGEIKVNPFILSADVSGFIVKERASQTTFVSFENAFVNLQSISIFKGGPVIKKLRIYKPYVNIVRSEQGAYNFSDLLEKAPSAASSPPKPSKPLRFSINNIEIVDGSIDFLDGPKAKKHTVRNLNLSVPFLSNLPYDVDTFVQPLFEAKINNNFISFSGKSKIFKDSHETSIAVDIKDLNIPYYLSYLPFKTEFQLPSGSLTVKGTLSYTQYRHRPPSIAFAGDINVATLKLMDGKGEPVVGFPLLSLKVDSSDFMAKHIRFSKISLNSPDIVVRRDKSGAFNFQSIIPKSSAAKTEESGPKLALEADDIEVVTGKCTFSDFSLDKAFQTTMSPIDVKISHFSTLPEKKSSLEAALLTEKGEELRLSGSFSVDPFVAEGALSLKGCVLKKYDPFYGKNLNFSIEAGSLDLMTRYALSRSGDKHDIKLSALEGAVSGLKLKKATEKDNFLAIPSIAVKNTEADLAKKTVIIGELTTSKGTLHTMRYADGSLNISNLVAVSQQPSQETSRGTLKKGPSTSDEKQWEISLKKLNADRYSVYLDDLKSRDPVHAAIEQIAVRGENISTAQNARGRIAVSARLNKTGKIKAGGTVTVEPLSARLQVACTGIDIMPFQPYVADTIKIALTGGNVAAQGHVTFIKSGDKEMKASYKGEASLLNFSSVDSASGDDFLKWTSLHLGGIEVGYGPRLDLNIAEISLTDFYSRVIINDDGTINLQDIVVKNEGTVKGESLPPSSNAAVSQVPAKEVLPRPSIKIGQVTLQGGTINFTDHHIEPHYAANLVEIGGRISGLTSDEDKFADVDLKGKVENYAPVDIVGKINPLRDDLYVSLKASCKDMDLSPFTPYSGKYAGYTIQKGKLTLALQYLIVKKKLDSQNNIFLDQLTLGEKVESPDATRLPVKLAIALLKNRKGEISLDIPVSGQIDDPKFSIGRIVLKIIVNLLTKAATSPFALLGALFGGGEELSYIEFDPGKSSVSDEAAKKLETLVKAMHERPGLKLEIAGYVDKEKDREGMRRLLFDRKVKAQKLQEMLKKRMPAVEVDEIKVSPEEYPKYLKAAYKAEKFPKPRNWIGMIKDIPVPEMEKLMLTHLEIKDEDLRILAQARANTVRDRLLHSKQIEPDRIFLTEPKSLSPDKKEKLSDSRVDFKLR